MTSDAGGATAALVRRDDRDGWAQLTLNRPDKLNALTMGSFRELRSHVEDLAADDSIGAVVLRGAGGCFSSGYDLGDVGVGVEVPPPSWQTETLRMLELLPKPVIAAPHGYCYTGGLELALAADFIVAADNTRFGDTHARWALTPLWGMSQRLPRRVGAATAKRLMFTGDIIDAAEALRIGLVEYIVPIADFNTEIESLASRIVANSSFSHTINKRTVDAADQLPIDAGLQYEIREGGVGPDARDRIDAFSAKKK